MDHRILLVDDELNVLQGYQRSLRKEVNLDVASSGAEALRRIADDGPYAVLVSDMRMPEMNGVELLARVKKDAPDTVRLMLTGNSDQQTAIDAINQGDIFRFLTKPCDKDSMLRALKAALRQHELITAEKELLQKTLSGSIRMLAEVLSLADPAAFGRTARLQKLCRQLVEELGIPRDWWLEPAVLLSQVGCITLPDKLSRKIASGQSLDNEEYRLYARHPSVGAQLLEKIPRMDQVVECIRYQEKNFDGTGVPQDGTKEKAIPVGARLLKVALDFDRHEASGHSPGDCLKRMQRQSKWYDPKILEALAAVVLGHPPMVARNVPLHALRENMVIAEDLRAPDGLLLVARGLSINTSLLQRLENFHRAGAIPGSLKILVSEPAHPQGAEG